MKLKTRPLVALAITLLAFAGVTLRVSAQTPATVPVDSAAAPSAAPARLQSGDLAPDFTVTGPQGQPIRLSDYRGKVVIVDVSATWCGPCQAAMPNNDRIARKYADQGVVFLGVTASDSKANYDGWMARNAAKYAFTMAFDPAGRDGWKGSVFNTGYHVSGFPTMFVIGADGKLVETVSGGGAGEDYRLEYALARAGVKVDLAAIPPEPKRDANAPKVIPATAKTPAAKSVPMIGMGGGMAPAKKATLGAVEFGAPVADFTATAPDGRDLKLSDFKGKTVIVTFFSNSERGPETYAVELAAKYAGQDVVLLAVGSAMEREKFEAWRKSANPAYFTAWDPAGKAWGESIPNLTFGVGMFPVFAVVDPAGKLAGGYLGMGAQNVERLKQFLHFAGVKLAPEDRPKSMPAGAVMRAPGGAAPAAAAAPRTLGPGDIAPDFTSLTVDDKEVKLSDFKGRIVILDFWATWCGPCIASFPHTQAIAAKYKDQDVVVLAAGTSDTIKQFKSWIPQNQPKYPDMIWAFDPHERGSATFAERASAKHYGVSGIPTQFVIGRDGKIVATIVGNGGKDDARTEAALAELGVKVDEATVARGREQLARAAEAQRAREAAMREEELNPKPQFRETFGALQAGKPVPDLTLESADGATVQLSDLTKGKTAVFAVWNAGSGPGEETLAVFDEWAKAYADQGVVFIGLGAYGSREDFDAWRAANAARISFPVVFDPAGAPPRPAKPFDEMDDAEKAAFNAASREFYPKVAPMQFTGGAMAMIPNFTVIDARGNMVGFFGGAGPRTPESLGNLLLRAGIKLEPRHMPAKVFTAAESKEPAPEARVERIAIGAMAPDFVTTDLDGKEIRISDYRGKTVVLDFWATWCGPCMAAMPHTQEVAAQYKDQDVVVLGSATSDTRANFERWVKANAAKYPDMVWSHDPAERKPERASRALYGVTGIPTQFIINPEGRIVDIVIGYMKGEVILDAALAKAGVKVDPAIVEKGAADLQRRAMLSGAAPAPALKLTPKQN